MTYEEALQHAGIEARRTTPHEWEAIYRGRRYMIRMNSVANDCVTLFDTQTRENIFTRGSLRKAIQTIKKAQ